MRINVTEGLSYTDMKRMRITTVKTERGSQRRVGRHLQRKKQFILCLSSLSAKSGHQNLFNNSV